MRPRAFGTHFTLPFVHAERLVSRSSCSSLVPVFSVLLLWLQLFILGVLPSSEHNSNSKEVIVLWPTMIPVSGWLKFRFVFVFVSDVFFCHLNGFTRPTASPVVICRIQKLRPAHTPLYLLYSFDCVFALMAAWWILSVSLFLPSARFSWTAYHWLFCLQPIGYVSDLTILQCWLF